MNIKIFSAKRKENAPIANESGFTIAEAVSGLAAFCTIAFFLPLAFKITLGYSSGEMSIQRMEWAVFSSQLKKEARMSNGFWIDRGKLYLDTEGGTVLFEKYGTNLRRRVNGTGHEIVLQNIAAVDFMPASGGFTVIAKDKNGRLHENYCSLFLGGRERHEE